ncbi:hypothetical protein [Sphingorhabdus sp.]|uniref:hypothetical protein n=1 Tax=Sphingorhabdus sp. TaxID=1902408 RepID=UPI0032B81497
MAGTDQSAALQAQFDYAAKCRVHTQMMPAIAKDVSGRQTGEAVYAYWIKESDRLGKKLGRTKEQLELDYLLIEIKADMDLLMDCAKKTKGVFKD